jgi:hypothetical protein
MQSPLSDPRVQNNPAMFRYYSRKEWQVKMNNRQSSAPNTLSDIAIPKISLSKCEYRKEQKALILPSENIGMPQQFLVRSHITGKEVRFVKIDQNDKLFDPDQWDGEQQIYRPVGNVPNVDYLVIFNRS